ncbi:carboxypeptidase-like regulatory domain-containing protein [Natronocalculus amylovorans]|uniref:Carboxypeptidase-like regulatory domain-containing protein n=1 Tax=Natronocalculus amylovorans TaxID=2917812 RepID=A0AAE3K972_9EURY|nr:carboxypeptidase-like regulatory domain-containing protein [Natronocalculus amylovorans]MCL9817781.1 carboxypeptidase-like regulatory domain-containing protein [Natronocalculus amylovorans]
MTNKNASGETTKEAPQQETKTDSAVEVLVSDQDGTALAGATVSLTGAVFETTAKTSQIGRCRVGFPTSVGTAELQVDHPAFDPMQATVAVADGAVIDVGLGVSVDESDTKRDEGLSSDSLTKPACRTVDSTETVETGFEWIGEPEEIEQKDNETPSGTSIEDKLIGVGGATKSDVDALVDSGYTSIENIQQASLEELRSVSQLDSGTALRLKAEFG